MFVILFSLIALVLSLIGWFLAMAISSNFAINDQADVFIPILISQIIAFIAALISIIVAVRAKKKKKKIGFLRSIGILFAVITMSCTVIITIFFANSLLGEPDVNKDIVGYEDFNTIDIEGIAK